MPQLAVSTYSLREHLGPTEVAFTDAEGNDQVWRTDFPLLLTVDEVPARLRGAFGVDTIETVGFQFGGLDDPRIDAFGAALDAEGVRLLNVAIDVGDLLATGEALAESVALLEGWVARFAALGARFVRVNPGSPFSADHGDRASDSLVEALRGLGAFARERGVRLLVENHGGRSSDPAWMNDLLERVGQQELGLLLDLGNFDAVTKPMMAVIVSGMPADGSDPFAGIDLESVYLGIEALADRAELVHVKAHRVDDDGTVGLVDLPRALAILADHGYDGPLTVEYEGEGGDPWVKTRAVLDLVSAETGVSADLRGEVQA